MDLKQKKPQYSFTWSHNSSKRLDVAIAAVCPISRRQAGILITSRNVTVNSAFRPKSEIIHTGDEVQIWAEPGTNNWQPAPDSRIKLKILFEDKHIAVLSKQSGIFSVPLFRNEKNTLAGAVAARYPESAHLGNPGDAGLINRLDKETSGIVMMAKNEKAFLSFKIIQKNKMIQKRYVAFTKRADILPEIKMPLEHCGPNKSLVRPSPKGRALTTKIVRIKKHGVFMLVTAQIHLGFKHQIRAHLAFNGAPITGDKLYGGAKIDGLKRLFLHAEKVVFPHPVTNNHISIRSPIPAELAEILKNYV